MHVDGAATYRPCISCPDRHTRCEYIYASPDVPATRTDRRLVCFSCRRPADALVAVARGQSRLRQKCRRRTWSTSPPSALESVPVPREKQRKEHSETTKQVSSRRITTAPLPSPDQLHLRFQHECAPRKGRVLRILQNDTNHGQDSPELSSSTGDTADRSSKSRDTSDYAPQNTVCSPTVLGQTSLYTLDGHRAAFTNEIAGGRHTNRSGVISRRPARVGLAGIEQKMLGLHLEGRRPLQKILAQLHRGVRGTFRILRLLACPSVYSTAKKLQSRVFVLSADYTCRLKTPPWAVHWIGRSESEEARRLFPLQCRGQRERGRGLRQARGIVETLFRPEKERLLNTPTPDHQAG